MGKKRTVLINVNSEVSYKSIPSTSNGESYTASSSATSSASYTQSDPNSVKIISNSIENALCNCEKRAIDYINNIIYRGKFDTSGTDTSGTDTSGTNSIDTSGTNSTYSVTSTVTQTYAFPWSGGQINGFFLWSGNFVGESDVVQYYAGFDTSNQILYDSSNSNIISSPGSYVYSDAPPPPSSDNTNVINGDTSGILLNMISLFSGYSNVTNALSSTAYGGGVVNYTTNSNLYSTAINYFNDNSITEYLLSLTLGGGSSNGAWNTGNTGGIYSVYEAVTTYNTYFSYTETGTNSSYDGVGTGELIYGTGQTTNISGGYNAYNCLCFDIETWDNISGSSGQDFLNLFYYIKNNINSTFYNTGVVIIVCFSHSGSYYNGSGYDLTTTLLSDPSGTYDYIAPQLYTQNIGINNEYTASYYLPWSSDTSGTISLLSCLQTNYNWSTYNVGMMLPSLNILSLLNNGGDYSFTLQGNNEKPSNLYWYQSTQDSSSATFVYSGTDTSLNYPIDNGATDFFNTVLESGELGGAIQWVNGTIETQSSYPWGGGAIKGFFLWGGNFVNYSPVTQYYASYDTSAQTVGDTSNSYISIGYGAYTYSGSPPPPTSDTSNTLINGETYGATFNMITLFSGYSNVNSALNLGMTNYTTGDNLYTTAITYFNDNNITDYLLSLALGGGASSTGSWNTGNTGSLYYVYEAVTISGNSFSYTETGTENKIYGQGTGALTYGTTSSTYSAYNCLFFDIETWDGDSGSTGQDFLNLFYYIKNSSNSTFYNSGVIIIASVAHSCSNYNGTGFELTTTLLSDPSGTYDYITPQLYTQDVGLNTEYTANSNLAWTSDISGSITFASCLNQNGNWNNYGSAMILPALNLLTLLNSGGDYGESGQGNNNKPTNLYWYQSDQTASYATFGYSGTDTSLNYPIDTGAQDFFNVIFNSGSVGGAVQWLNGTIDANQIVYPRPWNNTEIYGYASWETSFINGKVIYPNYINSNQNTDNSGGSSYNPLNGQSFITTQTGNFFAALSKGNDTNNFPSGLNAIYLYSAHSNASSALSLCSDGNNTIYQAAYDYLEGVNPHILGLALGGSDNTGQWNTGTDGAIYSIYEAVTISGNSFGYTESNTGNYLSGTGTGIIDPNGTNNNSFNGFMFDIVDCNSASSSSASGNGSSGIDFLNLFQYLKTSTNTTFYDPTSEAFYECIITVSFPHSSPYYFGTGGTVISTILEDAIGNSSGTYSYNFLAPKLFTNLNVGTMNEYCSGSQLSWNQFVTTAIKNNNIALYNVNMITPFVFTSNLITSAGSNAYGSGGYGNPNLYWLQSNDPSSNYFEASVSAVGVINNIPVDYGATNFFNLTFNNVNSYNGELNATIGGSVWWNNGSFSS